MADQDPCYICRDSDGLLLRSGCVFHCSCWYHRECALMNHGRSCPMCQRHDPNRPFSLVAITRNHFFSKGRLQELIVDLTFLCLLIVLLTAVEIYYPRIQALYLLILEEQERALTASSEALLPFAETLVDWSLAAVLPEQ